MKNLPDFIKISFRDEIFKLRPAPTSYTDLKESLYDLIPEAPVHPSLTYKDDESDIVKVCHDKGLDTYYSDLSTHPSLFLILQHNLDEVIQKNKSQSTFKSNEDDIINLSLLGLIEINAEILRTVKFTQTDFAKALMHEILTQARDTSIEATADEYELPWEVIFYMMQQPGFANKGHSKKINFNNVKNLLRPSKCLEVVANYVNNRTTKEEVLKTFNITQELLDLWVSLFRNPVIKPMELTHVPDKEKLKLVSCYLSGTVSVEDLSSGYDISQSQINSWAVYFCKEEKVYQRERFVSAEEKHDILQRYFKGEYSCTQFQNEYGVRGNLLYKWVKQVQAGKALTGSTIFRTASDELEQAYNIFLSSYR